MPGEMSPTHFILKPFFFKMDVIEKLKPSSAKNLKSSDFAKIYLLTGNYIGGVCLRRINIF